jgi:uncharacterized protein (TIGR03067 family)
VTSDKGDLAKMQGTWVLVSLSREGRPQPVEPLHLRVAGNRLTFVRSRAGRPLQVTLQVTLDETRSPRSLDLRVPDRPEAPPQQAAVYALTGDTLELVLHATSSTRRPKDLSGKGPGNYRQVFRRVER